MVRCAHGQVGRPLVYLVTSPGHAPTRVRDLKLSVLTNHLLDRPCTCARGQLNLGGVDNLTIEGVGPALEAMTCLRSLNVAYTNKLCLILTEVCACDPFLVGATLVRACTIVCQLMDTHNTPSRTNTLSHTKPYERTITHETLQTHSTHTHTHTHLRAFPFLPF